MLNGTSALGLDASGFYSQKFKKVGVTIFASYNLGTPYDPANIGLTAIPKFNRYTINPKVFLYLDEKTILKLSYCPKFIFLFTKIAREVLSNNFKLVGFEISNCIER